VLLRVLDIALLISNPTMFMKKIYLLKPYGEYTTNEIIEVEDILATDLIELGIARKTTNRDFLIKPQFGSESKAFQKAPSIIGKRLKK